MMLSEEEKEAIEEIKKDGEYYDILENIKQNKYNIWNVEKLMRDTTTCDFTEYEIAQSIVYFVDLIEKQQKEIEELKEVTWYYEISRVPKDKIKAKIEIRKEEKENCKDSIEEKYLLREIYVLQSLLEEE